MKLSVQKNSSLFLAISLLIGLLGGCVEQNEYAAPPPPTVTAAQPLQQAVTDYLEFTGTTGAVESVEVRARVKGFLESKHFMPGTDVDKGDLLFIIDPKPFEARLAAAKAELASAQARLMKAESDYKRKEIAGKKGAVTEADVVASRADRDAAKAAIAAANAAVTEAELNLGYARVTAPISGRVGRNLVDVGNLVGESEPTLLTTIVKYDPVYAYFNVNERDLLRLLKTYRAKLKEKGIDPRTEPDVKAEITIYLGLTNEEGFPHEGLMDFAESGVDSGTGTMQLRSVFPNPESPPVLLPGLFARLRMPVAKRQDALLVSERALGADQGGQYLLVVNSENIVEKRTVALGQALDGLTVIDEGIRAEDWVIVKGVQRARPGGAVNPERIEMASLATSAKAPASATPTAKPSDEDKPEATGKAGESPAASTENSSEDTSASSETPSEIVPEPAEPSEDNTTAEPASNS